MSSNDATRVVENEAGLREIVGPTMDIAVQKSRPKLDRHSKAFIGRSPFLCIGTSNAEGKADVSPRGDPPGFVQIIGDDQLFIPDRPGNNRLDTMTNITENPNVGLLFVIPGFNDTLRVNGKARVVQDEEKAERPTACAKPTIWTRGIEWHTQQKKLMNASVQNPWWRSTLPHKELTDWAAREDVGDDDGDAGAGVDGPVAP